MELSVIRRRFVVLLVLAIITISSLIFLSAIQEPVIEYLTRFIKIINHDTIDSNQMSALASELLKNLFRIFKIILWFILVIAFIRFLNSLQDAPARSRRRPDL